MASIATARRVAAHYVSDEKILSVEHRGEGLINATFLVRAESNKPPNFILQRINHEVFPRPEQIMENLETLLQHTHQTHGGNGSPALRIPAIYQTLDGLSHFTDSDGAIWRAQEFVENTRTLKTIRHTRDAEEVGFALGAFHRMVHDLEPQLLHTTLSGFHNTSEYLGNYQRISARSMLATGLFEEQACAEFINARSGQASILENAKSQGLLRLRPIHGDPKMDNILFDRNTGRAVSIIDLDTIMPGLIHYDIGDCLRSCCNSGGESSASKAPVDFDLDICRAILGAYLKEAGNFLTAHDYTFIYDAIRLIPFELGLRFFTDYLEGNKYFKNITHEETLYRAKTQFKLVERIEQKQDLIRRLIAELAAA